MKRPCILKDTTSRMRPSEAGGAPGLCFANAYQRGTCIYTCTWCMRMQETDCYSKNSATSSIECHHVRAARAPSTLDCADTMQCHCTPSALSNSGSEPISNAVVLIDGLRVTSTRHRWNMQARRNYNYGNAYLLQKAAAAAELCTCAKAGHASSTLSLRTIARPGAAVP